MRLAVLLLSSLLAFGQSTAPSTEPKAQPPASAPDQKSQIQDLGPPGKTVALSIF